VAVVGGGYIGLEVAASCRALGVDVVVLEREKRLLARVACESLAEFFHAQHKSRGVRFKLNSRVLSFEGVAGRVTAVKLAEGEVIECDAAVVGVGARPNEELAAEAGLRVSHGVVVDLDARSVSDPAIFAIGDVAYRPMPIYNCMFRAESVPNALEQARQAASAITGRPRPKHECPWQWSDQYDLKLQIAGYAFGADQMVIRGDPATARFAIFHLKGSEVRSVEAINSPAEFMSGKSLILSRQPVDKAKLLDLAVSMRAVTADGVGEPISSNS
jgi:3-phenylpropionate/trans-cinnamate dioxygenase ferredoxin reductase subunit